MAEGSLNASMSSTVAAKEREMQRRITTLERRNLVLQKLISDERAAGAELEEEIKRVRKEAVDIRVAQRKWGPPKSHLAKLGAAELTRELLTHRRRKIKLLVEKLARATRRKDGYIDDITALKVEINTNRRDHRQRYNNYKERRRKLERLRHQMAQALEWANVVNREKDEAVEQLEQLEKSEERAEKEFLRQEADYRERTRLVMARLEMKTPPNQRSLAPQLGGMDIKTEANMKAEIEEVEKRIVEARQELEEAMDLVHGREEALWAITKPLHETVQGVVRQVQEREAAQEELGDKPDTPAGASARGWRPKTPVATGIEVPPEAKGASGVFEDVFGVLDAAKQRPAVSNDDEDMAVDESDGNADEDGSDDDEEGGGSGKHRKPKQEGAKSAAAKEEEDEEEDEEARAARVLQQEERRVVELFEAVTAAEAVGKVSVPGLDYDPLLYCDEAAERFTKEEEEKFKLMRRIQEVDEETNELDGEVAALEKAAHDRVGEEQTEHERQREQEAAWLGVLRTLRHETAKVAVFGKLLEDSISGLCPSVSTLFEAAGGQREDLMARVRASMDSNVSPADIGSPNLAKAPKRRPTMGPGGVSTAGGGFKPKSAIGDSPTSGPASPGSSPMSRGRRAEATVADMIEVGATLSTVLTFLEAAESRSAMMALEAAELGLRRAGTSGGAVEYFAADEIYGTRERRASLSLAADQARMAALAHGIVEENLPAIGSRAGSRPGSRGAGSRGGPRELRGESRGDPDRLVFDDDGGSQFSGDGESSSRQASGRKSAERGLRRGASPQEETKVDPALGVRSRRRSLQVGPAMPRGGHVVEVEPPALPVKPAITRNERDAQFRVKLARLAGEAPHEFGISSDIVRRAGGPDPLAGMRAAAKALSHGRAGKMPAGMGRPGSGQSARSRGGPPSTPSYSVRPTQLPPGGEDFREEQTSTGVITSVMLTSAHPSDERGRPSQSREVAPASPKPGSRSPGSQSPMDGGRPTSAASRQQHDDMPPPPPALGKGVAVRRVRRLTATVLPETGEHKRGRVWTPAGGDLAGQNKGFPFEEEAKAAGDGESSPSVPRAVRQSTGLLGDERRGGDTLSGQGTFSGLAAFLPRGAPSAISAPASAKDQRRSSTAGNSGGRSPAPPTPTPTRFASDSQAPSEQNSALFSRPPGSPDPIEDAAATDIITIPNRRKPHGSSGPPMAARHRFSSVPTSPVTVVIRRRDRQEEEAPSVQEEADEDEADAQRVRKRKGKKGKKKKGKGKKKAKRKGGQLQKLPSWSNSARTAASRQDGGPSAPPPPRPSEAPPAAAGHAAGSAQGGGGRHGLRIGLPPGSQPAVRGAGLESPMPTVARHDDLVQSVFENYAKGGTANI